MCLYFFLLSIVVVLLLTWTCGLVRRAYKQASDTSSGSKNGMFCINSMISGLKISVLTAPGLILCKLYVERKINQLVNVFNDISFFEKMVHI